jgi:Icc-related predicted phosphoesterase
LGCQYLLDELWRKRPRLHVFGHVHDGYGVEWVRFDGLQRAYETVVIAGGGLPCFIG